MEEEALLFSRSNFELSSLYANLAMGHEEFHSNNVQNKQQEKANKFTCELLHGNPWGIHTNECYQDIAHT